MWRGHYVGRERSVEGTLGREGEECGGDTR